MRDELLALLKSVVQRGSFTLASGKTSTYYIDGRLVTLSGRGARLIAGVLLPLLRRERVAAVGGLTMGADPIAAAVAAESARDGGTPLDAFLVRKEAKSHGTAKSIEGPPLKPGMRVAIVDDVLTTGGSLLKAIEAARAAGAVPVHAYVLVDRAEGGREAVERAAVPVTALFTIDEVLG